MSVTGDCIWRFSETTEIRSVLVGRPKDGGEIGALDVSRENARKNA
jgi:hypothetical protein